LWLRIPQQTIGYSTGINLKKFAQEGFDKPLIFMSNLYTIYIYEEIWGLFQILENKISSIMEGVSYFFP
jgi:hypothetical protein